MGKGQFNEERDQSMGKGQSFQQTMLEKLVIHMKKNEIECLSQQNIQNLTQNESNTYM